MGRGTSMTSKLKASEAIKIRDIEHYANSYGLTFTGGVSGKELTALGVNRLNEIATAATDAIKEYGDPTDVVVSFEYDKSSSKDKLKAFFTSDGAIELQGDFENASGQQVRKAIYGAYAEKTLNQGMANAAAGNLEYLASYRASIYADEFGKMINKAKSAGLSDSEAANLRKRTSYEGKRSGGVTASIVTAFTNAYTDRLMGTTSPLGDGIKSWIDETKATRKVKR